MPEINSNYCSLNSKHLNENLFATAPYFKKLLLIEYNSAWSEKPLHQNNLPIEANEVLLKFRNSEFSNRVLFIKNRQSRREHINIFAVHNLKEGPYINHSTITNYKGLVPIFIDDLFSKKESEKLAEKLYLVCTNGKKDKCCAKFGIPVFNKLSQLDSNVWECTHIAGDRFAPNVLVLPYCTYYGSLDLDNLSLLIELTDQQKVYLDRFRGRSCYSKIEQAAEYFLRKKENNFDLFAYDHLSTTEIFPDYFEIVFRNMKTGELMTSAVKRIKEPIKRKLTCNSDEEQFPITYQLVERD